jgi:hypothetical protein
LILDPYLFDTSQPKTPQIEVHRLNNPVWWPIYTTLSKTTIERTEGRWPPSPAPAAVALASGELPQVWIEYGGTTLFLRSVLNPHSNFQRFIQLLDLLFLIYIPTFKL